jgi:hypothetical protein
MSRWVVLLLVVGCAIASCKPRSGAASLGAVPVVAPFDAMALPIGDGVVWACDGARIKIVYDNGDRSHLADTYAQALEQRGWSGVQPPSMSSQQWIGRYRKRAELLTLEVHDADFNGKVPHGVEVFIAITDAT